MDSTKIEGFYMRNHQGHDMVVSEKNKWPNMPPAILFIGTDGKPPKVWTEQEVAAKDQRIAELEEALGEFLAGDKHDLCDILSHPGTNDRHRMGEPCPPLERIAALLNPVTQKT